MAPPKCFAATTTRDLADLVEKRALSRSGTLKHARAFEISGLGYEPDKSSVSRLG